MGIPFGDAEFDETYCEAARDNMDLVKGEGRHQRKHDGPPWAFAGLTKERPTMDTNIESKEVGPGKWEIRFTARVYPSDRQAFEQSFAAFAAALAPKNTEEETRKWETKAHNLEHDLREDKARIEDAYREISNARAREGKLADELGSALRALTERSVEVEDLRRELANLKRGGGA